MSEQQKVSDLNPTHQCFDDALDFIDLMVKAKRQHLEDWRLVHALCRSPMGAVFAHAWCERNGESVVSAFIINGKHTYIEVDREGFYEVFRPYHIIRYTIHEAARQNFKHYHYGPWDPRIRAVCSKGGREILGSVEVRISE